MTIKRVVLAILTIFAIAQVGLSLNNSLSQPQIRGRLELYQTNLVLHVAEFKTNPQDDFELNSAVSSLVGEDPYSAARKKYQQVRQESITTRDNFQSQLQQLDNSQSDTVEIANPQANQGRKKQLERQIAELNQFINELDVKRGILAAVSDKPQEAIQRGLGGFPAARSADRRKTTGTHSRPQRLNQEAIAIWEKAIARIDNSENRYAQTANVLRQLWQEQTPDLTADARDVIKSNLDSWFSYQALAQYDRVNDLSEDLSALEERERQIAADSAVKLAVISGLPFFGSIFGTILLIFLIVQRLVKKETSIIATNNALEWETPWDWEITWQVLIVGFFFVTQFVIPLLLGLFQINPVDASLRVKSLYILGTYLAMAIGGISVLYFSIKSFLPLPQGWFKFKLTDNWFVWGFGGYLVALPLVLIVSLINQLIWQGQGGSNPLLLLALQAQDKVALAIFFVTSSIAAPVFEEIMFRGFLLPSLTRYVSVSGAIIISGLIFAVAHLSLSEVLPLATLGIVLGFVYTRSRNLLAPMLLHCLWNSGTLVSLFVLGSSI